MKTIACLDSAGRVRAFAALVAAALAASSFAKTPAEVSREKHYPERYCADTDTPEARAALIAELWRHDLAAGHERIAEAISLAVGDLLK